MMLNDILLLASLLPFAPYFISRYPCLLLTQPLGMHCLPAALHVGTALQPLLVNGTSLLLQHSQRGLLS